MGSLARALEDYLTDQHLALPTGQAERLAAGRRQRRIDATPSPLRPAAAGFCEYLLAARERARRGRIKPRTDGTIEAALATVRDFASFLAGVRGKLDWALVAAALGMNPEGVMIYLADHVDTGRLPVGSGR